MLRACARLAAVLSVLALESFINLSSSFGASAVNDGLDASVRSLLSNAVPAATCTTAGQRPKEVKLGLWAIANEKSPLGEGANKRVYDEIVARLLSMKPKCVAIIDSVGIGVIADHLQKSGALDEAGGNVLAALGEAHQNVDIVVFPELIAQGETVSLSLRAVERASTKTLALTKPVALPASLIGSSSNDTAVSLDEAV